MQLLFDGGLERKYSLPMEGNIGNKLQYYIYEFHEQRW